MNTPILVAVTAEPIANGYAGAAAGSYAPTDLTLTERFRK